MAHIRAVLLVALIGCGPDDDGGGPDPVEVDCPTEGTPATWTNFADGYVTTWCLPCHSSALDVDERYGAPLDVNFDTFDLVVAQAAQIKAWSTGPTPLMPPAGGPTDEERQLLDDWIACDMPGGAPEPADPCSAPPSDLAGDLVISTAAEMDGFCDTYNGVSGHLSVVGDVDVSLDCVCRVGGDLQVSGQARSVSLPRLATVGGGVDLRAASALASVTLPDLATVGGDFAVLDNPTLSEIEASRLESVGGALDVEGNPALGRLWLSDLASTGGDWRVASNDGLVSVSTDSLQAVGGSFVLEANPTLGYLFGDAYQVSSVGGDLRIVGNAQFAGSDMLFFELASLGGDLEISGNGTLEAVQGFELLAEIPGHLWIRDNASLFAVDGFDFLDRVGGSLDISGNPKLAVIDNFTDLLEVGGDGDPASAEHELRVQDNASLLGLPGLLGVAFVGRVVVTDNPSLASLEGFHDAQLVGDGVVIARNASLVEVDAFGLASSLGGSISVTDNASLTAIEGFYSTASLPGSLEISRNPALIAVELGSANNPFVSIDGDLLVVDNDALQDLAGLETLQVIGGSLALSGNASLSDVAALHGLTSIDGDLTVTDNTALATAEATALRDAVDDIGGVVTISGNAP